MCVLQLCLLGGQRRALARGAEQPGQHRQDGRPHRHGALADAAVPADAAPFCAALMPLPALHTASS
jgi:hypothetical protein